MSSDNREKDRKRRYSIERFDNGEDEYESSPSPPKRTCLQTTYTMEVPEQFVGLIIGRNGNTIGDIASKTGCRMQVDTRKTVPGFRNMYIQGLEDNIQEARKMIEMLLSSSDNPRKNNPSTIEIPIPLSACGAIIGKGGEMMKKLRSWSNCHITLIQDSNGVASNGTTKPLRITGMPEDIEKAKILVADILSKTVSEEPRGSLMPCNSAANTSTIEIIVPRSAVGAIMGARGSNIKKISDETRVKIQFLEDTDPKMMERRLAVIGNHTRCAVAVKLIKNIVDANTSEAEQVSLFFMDVPSWKCGLVIGRSGETIKGISNESGAHCELTRDHPNNLEKRFVIRGNALQVEHAKHLIRCRVGDLPPGTPFTPSNISFNPYETYQQKADVREGILQNKIVQLVNTAPPSLLEPMDFAEEWLKYYEATNDAAGIILAKERIRERDAARDAMREASNRQTF